MKPKLLGAKLGCQAVAYLTFSFLHQTTAFIALFTLLYGTVLLVMSEDAYEIRRTLKELGRVWLGVVLVGAEVFEYS